MRIRITKAVYTIPITSQRSRVLTVPRWALRLCIKQQVRTNLRRQRAELTRRGYIVHSWRRQAMINQHYQRRASKHRKAVLVH